MRTALSDGDVIEPAPGDFNLFATIGTILSQEDVPSDLRQALFEVAASIPSVNVEHAVPDPLRRPAIAVSFSDHVGTTRLYFDPEDARFLGRSESIPSEEGRPGILDWRAYVARGLVEELGDRPAT